MTNEAIEVDVDDEAGDMSPEQLAEAKVKGWLELICDLADRAIDFAYLGVMAFVAASPIDEWLKTFSWVAQNDTLRLAAIFVIVFCLHMAASFGLSWYSGFRLEHRFGLSRQSFAAWLRDYVKRMGLALIVGLVMFVGLYWIIWTCGPWWWVVAAVAFFLASVVMGQLYPVLIAPLFHKIEKLDDPDLSRRMARLANGTSLSIEGVYRLCLSEETIKANAYLAGLGSTRRVLLGDTALDNFSHDEIEVIIGHEIGHHVHRHIPKMIVAGMFFSGVGFWLFDRFVISYVQSQQPDVTYANFPVWTLPLLMFTLAVFSQVLEPLVNAISRHYERQCDRYALESTGLVDAYRSAFRKLAKQNKDDPDPHPLEVFLFHSHPPIKQRLAMADRV